MSKTLAVVGDVEGKVCVIVDDMIDTAGTLVNGAEALVAAGAAEVYAAATHPVLSDPATDRIKNSPIHQVVVTNTLPIPSEKQTRQARRPVDRSDDRPDDQGGLRGGVRLRALPRREPALATPLARPWLPCLRIGESRPGCDDGLSQGLTT